MQMRERWPVVRALVQLIVAAILLVNVLAGVGHEWRILRGTGRVIATVTNLSSDVVDVPESHGGGKWGAPLM